MLHDFYIHVPPTIVGMGRTKEIGQFLHRWRPKRTAIITDNNMLEIGLSDNITACLEKEGYTFDIFSDCEVHAPSRCIEKCSEFVREGKFDLIIGIGGGSVMDTVKAVSVIAPNSISFDDFINGRSIQNAITKILVPTTAGTGSEWSMTGVYYDNEKEEEKLVIGEYLSADGVIIDPELTLHLPQKVAAESGMDALTHAVEAYTSSFKNTIADVFAENAIKLISENLRLAYAKGFENPEARYKMSIAASMAMNAVAMNGAGLAHFLNPPIVKKAHVSHGQACIMMLPHTMKFNLIACPERYSRIAALMGENMGDSHFMDEADKAIRAVKNLSKDVGMDQRLTDIGIAEDDIPGMTETTLKKFHSRIDNFIPRIVMREDIISIYTEAL